MSSKVLPILNAIGCVVLIGLIALQWIGGQGLELQLHEAKRAAIEQENARREAENKNEQLKSDVEGLKASIEAIREQSARDQAAAAEASKVVEARQGEAVALNEQLTKAVEQLKIWEEAVKARDEKLKELNEALVATRKRLDEAVGKLKEAGAR